jgi:hypothetical protein
MADKRMQYNQIIAKAWGNDMFRQKLVRDPAGTLKQEGVDLPAGVSVKVMEDSDQVVHFVLPKKPAGGVGTAEDFVIC